MSFNWEDYLTLAEKLKQEAGSSPQKEAMLRSSISRAYYSAFCLAKNHLYNRDGIVNTGTEDVHAFVRKQFSSSKKTDRRSVGENLNRLRIYRNKADYDDVVSSLDNTTLFAINMAKTIVDILHKL